MLRHNLNLYSNIELNDHSYHNIEYTEIPSITKNQKKDNLLEIKKKEQEFYENNTPLQGFWKIITGKGPLSFTDHLVHDIPSIYTEAYLDQYTKNEYKSTDISTKKSN
jgi:hypothetical protein